jgi:hypothetical protein
MKERKSAGSSIAMGVDQGLGEEHCKESRWSLGSVSSHNGVF